MSVKELIVLPKQKFETLSKSNNDSVEMKSVACQTDFTDHENSEKVDDMNGISSTAKDENLRNEIAQRVKDGFPGKLDGSRSERQRRLRRKIKWIPY